MISKWCRSDMTGQFGGMRMDTHDNDALCSAPPMRTHPNMHKHAQSSSLTPSASVDPGRRGQHKAGEVTLNLYSHFSGSEMESSAFVVPHVMST